LLRDKIKIGLICFIAGGIIFTIMVKSFWPTVKTEIEYISTGTTIHTTDTGSINVNNPGDCQIAKDCANSDIKVEAEVKDDIIFGTAGDDCKTTDFKIKLKIRQSFRHTFQVGYLYQMKIGQSIELSYFYNFNLFQIGGGLILNKDYPGIKVSVQKSF
jgi:hypothetical protein